MGRKAIIALCVVIAAIIILPAINIRDIHLSSYSSYGSVAVSNSPNSTSMMVANYSSMPPGSVVKNVTADYSAHFSRVGHSGGKMQWALNTTVWEFNSSSSDFFIIVLVHLHSYGNGRVSHGGVSPFVTGYQGNRRFTSSVYVNSTGGSMMHFAPANAFLQDSSGKFGVWYDHSGIFGSLSPGYGNSTPPGGAFLSAVVPLNYSLVEPIALEEYHSGYALIDQNGQHGLPMKTASYVVSDEISGHSGNATITVSGLFLTQGGFEHHYDVVTQNYTIP